MNGNIKNALLVVVIIAVIAGSALLAIKPNIEAKQSLDGEIATLQQRLAELQAKEADRPIYEAGIIKNRQEFAEIMKKFPNGIEQENYIKFLGDLEDNEDIEYLENSIPPELNMDNYQQDSIIDLRDKRIKSNQKKPWGIVKTCPTVFSRFLINSKIP